MSASGRSSVHEDSYPSFGATIAQLLQQGPPEDPADLTVALYGALEARPGLSRDHGWIQTWARRCAEGEGYVSASDLRDLLAGHDDDRIHRRAYTVLLGLDDAFRFVRDDGPWPKALRQNVVRWINGGSLARRDPATFGALIPRIGRGVATPNEPELSNVIVVPPGAWSAFEHQVLDSRLVGRFTWSRRLRIGAAPMVEHPKELEWQVERVGSVAKCRVSPKDSRRLRRRIVQVLRQLDNSEADIALLPELTLSHTILAYWRETLKASPRPRHTNLRWLLLGSGPVTSARMGPVTNRAVLLPRDGDGEPIVQDKKGHFAFDKRTIDNYGLPGCSNCDIAEEVTGGQGGKSQILDLPVGRVAIVISDDLSQIRSTPLLAHGISLILSPTLLMAQLRDRHAYLAELCASHGVTAVAATSLVRDRTLTRGGSAAAGVVWNPTPMHEHVATAESVWVADL